VKLEQASKDAMWMPTRRFSGEGRANPEEPGAGARQTDNHRHGLGHRGSEHSMPGR